MKMFNNAEYRQGNDKVKKIRGEIERLWGEHERAQAELYVASGWSPEQLAQENPSYRYEIPKGARAEIKRAIAFGLFIRWNSKRERKLENLRRYEFDDLFKSWGDDWPRIEEGVIRKRAPRIEHHPKHLSDWVDKTA